MTLALFLLTALIACELCGHSVVKDFPWLSNRMPKHRLLRGLVKFFLGGLVLSVIAGSFLLIEFISHMMES